MSRLGRAYPNNALMQTLGRRSVALDVVGPGGSVYVNGASSEKASWSHTCTQGSQLLIFVLAQSAGNTPSITAATYGSTNLTSIGSVNMNNSSTNGTLFLLGMANVSGGAQTVSITFNGGFYAVGNSISYMNVRSVSAPATVFGNGSALSQSASCGAGQLIVQSFGNQGFAAVSLRNGGVLRSSTVQPTQGKEAVSISDASASATFTTTLNGSDNWGGIAVVLSP